MNDIEFMILYLLCMFYQYYSSFSDLVNHQGYLMAK